METIVTLLVALAIFGIAWWAINQFDLPPPLRMVAVVIIAIVAILLLLPLAGGPGIHFGSLR